MGSNVHPPDRSDRLAVNTSACLHLCLNASFDFASIQQSALHQNSEAFLCNVSKMMDSKWPF